MKETPLNKVLNTMRQYVENIYEHDSEPMLNWKDIKLVLDEIERLNNIINELEKWLEIEERKCKKYATDDYEGGYVDAINTIIVKLQELKEGK